MIAAWLLFLISGPCERHGKQSEREIIGMACRRRRRWAVFCRKLNLHVAHTSNSRTVQDWVDSLDPLREVGEIATSLLILYLSSTRRALTALQRGVFMFALLAHSLNLMLRYNFICRKDTTHELERLAAL